MSPKPRILFVDDEPDLLKSIKLALRKQFKVDTATSGQAGLDLIASSKPFPVIVSDMRMPEMNGARFLEATRKASKDSTRILLTGETDLNSAIDAVNKGAIFRFLKKPCGTQELADALEAGVEQHRLVTAEKDLLQNTLRGSLKLLTDILGHVHPQAFSRSTRVRMIVHHVIEQLSVRGAWAYEIAGMLAHLGLVTVPPDTVAKECAGDPLDERDRELISRHPAIGSRMLESIPRLEAVAGMIARQNTPATPEETSGPPDQWSPAVLGGELLRMAVTFEHGARKTGSTESSLEQLHKVEPAFHPALLACLDGYQMGREGMSVASLMIDQLAPGMVTEQDVLSTAGGLLATKGQTIDGTFLERLRNFAGGVGVQQPIRVLSPDKYLFKNRSA